MIIQIGQPGPPALMDMSIYAKPSMDLELFRQAHHQRTLQTLQPYGDAAMHYLQAVTQAHQDYRETSGIAMVQRLVDIGEIATSNGNFYIYPITDLKGLRHASVEMQPYLMANPLIRILHIEGRIEGYPDTYLPPTEMAAGVQDEVYLSVVNGLGNWSYDPEAKDYFYVETIGDSMATSLSLKEQLNVIQSWAEQNYAIQQGEDPTSIDGFKVRPED